MNSRVIPLSVVVASKNGVKLRAVAGALRELLPGVEHRVMGVPSASGVLDQPYGDEMTLRGATNRVASIRQQYRHTADLLVAIEGGIGEARPLPCGAVPAAAAAAADEAADEAAGAAAGPGAAWTPVQQQQQQQQQQQLECFAWVVVEATAGGAAAHTRSASFPLPPPLADLILKEGLELGEADDRLFGRTKSGHGSGTIGHLTRGAVTRESYYQQAAVCALLPLLNPGLYGPNWVLPPRPLRDGADEQQ